MTKNNIVQKKTKNSVTAIPAIKDKGIINMSGPEISVRYELTL